MTWPDFDLVDVASDDAVHQAGRIFAGDQILVERRDVDERGRVADGVVLVLVVHFVHADGVVARPFAVVQAVAEGESSLVKCGSDGQRDSSLRRFFREPDENRLTTKDTKVTRRKIAEVGLYSPVCMARQ